MSLSSLWLTIPRPQRIGGAVVLVIMSAVGFVPLFGGPGYEHALASGLVVPGAAAIATALDLVRKREGDPLAAVGRGVASGAFLAAVAFATALVHGARVGICDLAGGYANREIAQRLFITHKTVEAHLARAFRKLHIDSRASSPRPPPANKTTEDARPA